MADKHVDFTEENVGRCLCMDCPVQSASACAQEKMSKRQPVSVADPPEDTPKVYCVQGKAVCDDLDFSQSCSCPGCAVWAQYGLSNYKYCENGNAEALG